MSNLNVLLEDVKNENPASFKKHLKEEINSRLGVSLAEHKKVVVAGMFGITEKEEMPFNKDGDDDEKKKDDDDSDSDDTDDEKKKKDKDSEKDSEKE